MNHHLIGQFDYCLLSVASGRPVYPSLFVFISQSLWRGPLVDLMSCYCEDTLLRWYVVLFHECFSSFTMASKRKRGVLLLADKLNILQKSNKGIAGKQLAKMYGVELSTIFNIKRSKPKIFTSCYCLKMKLEVLQENRSRQQQTNI